MNDDTKKIEDEEVMNENTDYEPNMDTQEESMEDLTGGDVDTAESEAPVSSAVGGSGMKDNWIEVVNGEFTCSECENTSKPETNTVDGTVEADTVKILNDLTETPTKIVYGSCPVCGMEYVFKAHEGKLFMEPSDMLK